MSQRLRFSVYVLSFFLCIAPGARAQAVSTYHFGSPSRHPSGWLGVSVTDLTPEKAEELATNQHRGAVVQEVVQHSPADSAGILPDDIIVSVQGKAIRSSLDLLKAVGRTKPGSKVTIGIVHGTSKKSLAIVLGRQRDHRLARHSTGMARSFSFPSCHDVGMSLTDLGDQLASYFQVPGGAGVLVKSVDEDGPADEAGFQAGDIIVTVARDTVWSVTDVWEALSEEGEGDSLAVGILRKGNSRTLVLHPGDDGESGMFEMGIPEPPCPPPIRMHPQFQREMEEFGNHMKAFGLNLQHSLRGLGERIREELRHATL